MIAAATGKRIKECKGFVGDEDDFGDKSVSGHGTHVTRILLQVAHAAEFYIAKISDDISVEARDMGNISRVSVTSYLSPLASLTVLGTSTGCR